MTTTPPSPRALFSHSVLPVSPQDAGPADHECEVLVVGCGAAGAAAALEAHAAGAAVTVLEGASGPGGSAAQSGGEIYLGGGTATQHAAGITDDTAEDMARFLSMALGPDADEAKIADYSAGAVEHHDWLVGHGVPFKPTIWDEPTWVPPTDDGLMWMGETAHPFAAAATPAPRGHRVTADGFGGKVLMAVLTAAIDKTGAIRVDTDTTALRLVVDEGRVRGVIARRFGEELHYRADAVVITTGGFVDNDAMLAEHAPALLGLGKNSDGRDDGRGIVMAQAAGAAIRRTASAQIGISTLPGYMTRGIVVDERGHRFINEDVYPGLVGIAAHRNHGLAVWVVIDERGYEEVPEEQRWGLQPTFVAETLAELEAEMGVPAGALERTVTEYNRHAEAGEDPYFHKSARWLRPLCSPFAAIDVRRGFAPPEYGQAGAGGAETFTLGGLHTDTHGRVLDLDGRPLTGLYAAGRAASELHGGGYISGTSLGPGTFFGRRAGRLAAGGA